MAVVYLLLGGNLGDREAYIQRSRDLIQQELGTVPACSSLYETAAWGLTDQPAYLNQVIQLETELKPIDLLDRTQDIELRLGRERLEKWGARVIDIDILFYGDTIVNSERLTVPHPHFHERRFAVEPMLELNPDFLHPLLEKSIKSIALELTDKLSVQRI